VDGVRFMHSAAVMELFMLLKWAHFHCAADSFSLHLHSFSFASAGLPFHKPVTSCTSECMESKSCWLLLQQSLFIFLCLA